MSDELKACPFCGKMPRENSVTLPFDVGGRRKIAQCACGAFLYTGRWNTRPIEAELQQRIDELTAELTALREQVRWIPVSERLPELKTYASREDIIICPEDYTIVITVDDKGYVSPAYFSYDGMFLDDYEMPAEPMVYGKTLFFSECLGYSSEIINNVTHWMPLPLPPEGE